ncbi:DUF3006 domain-containing protein [Ruminococcus sp. Marseille-P6503]|uniref:DUF3006 domain-containing protein n=1 Tax=Ruminococcus sp. Marseille-P6503 TaxID=2364796 RepID=UPI000F541AE1|nr:DUF3006 domain-containing protein [Ruminococcus sp. Marseille-P6503]
MKLIIDRREGESFVCEDENGKRVVIPCVQAENAEAGDIVEYADGSYKVLAAETDERRRRMNKLLDSLWE